MSDDIWKADGVAAEIAAVLLVYLDEAYHRHERE
jgi:hypothetical protein